MKLDSGQKHFLTLIAKDAGMNGWCKVSHVMMPLVQKMPTELVESEAINDDGSGSARLTPQGRSVVYAMQWL